MSTNWPPRRDAGLVARSIEIGGELHGIARDLASGRLSVAAREQRSIATIDRSTGTATFADAALEPYRVGVDGTQLAESDAKTDVVRTCRTPGMNLVTIVPIRARGHQVAIPSNWRRRANAHS